MARTAARALLGIATAVAVGTGVEPREPVDPARLVVAATTTPAAVVPDPTVPVTPPPLPAPDADEVIAPPPPQPAPRADPAPEPEASVQPAAVAAPASLSPPTPTAGPQERSDAALAEAVPAMWRDALPATVQIIEGSTSYASRSMTIRVGRYHADGPWSHLVSVIGHEFGHLIAFVYGTNEFNGAAPEGWPDPQHGPAAEAWADCVSEVFTGIVDPSYGMPPCPQPTLEWTANWLAAGPP